MDTLERALSPSPEFLPKSKLFPVQCSDTSGNKQRLSASCKPATLPGDLDCTAQRSSRCNSVVNSSSSHNASSHGPSDGQCDHQIAL